MMKWFGPSPKWNTGFPPGYGLHGAERIAAPIEHRCINCDEFFVKEDHGLQDCGGSFSHIECFIRGIVGSLGHQRKMCSCYRKVGETFGDPPGFTRRQAARAAWEWWSYGQLSEELRDLALRNLSKEINREFGFEAQE